MSRIIIVFCIIPLLLQRSNGIFFSRFFSNPLTQSTENRARALQTRLTESNGKIDDSVINDSGRFRRETELRTTVLDQLTRRLREIDQLESLKRGQGLSTDSCTGADRQYLENFMTTFDTTECNTDAVTNTAKLRRQRRESADLNREIERFLADVRRLLSLSLIDTGRIESLERRVDDLTLSIDDAIVEARNNVNECINGLRRRSLESINRHGGNVNRCLNGLIPKVPVTPQIPNVPVTPQIPNVPVTPQIPNVPVTPQVPVGGSSSTSAPAPAATPQVG